MDNIDRLCCSFRQKTSSGGEQQELYPVQESKYQQQVTLEPYKNIEDQQKKFTYMMLQPHYRHQRRKSLHPRTRL
jgi:hypothetical protein